MSGDRWFRDRYRDAIWESGRLTADQKAIAETYARHARDESGYKSSTADVAWVTYDRMAEKAGVVRKHIKGATDVLEASGWLIAITRTRGRPTVYRLAIPAEVEPGSIDVDPAAVSTSEHGSSPGSIDVGPAAVSETAPAVSTWEHGSIDVSPRPLINQPSISSPSAGAHRSEVRRIVAATGATDDEAHSVIEKIKNGTKLKRPFGVYFSSIPDEHLVDHLAEVRAAAATHRQTVTSEEFHAVRMLAKRCDHEVPGGYLVNPNSGVPTCPNCRRAFLAREGNAA